MASPRREICLLLALVVLPVIYAAFCVGMSRRRKQRLASYLAYYLLLGCVAGWCLVAGLWPSSMSRVFGWCLLTCAPLACLGCAATLQKTASRTGFDAGAMVGCYLYALLAAGVALVLLGGGAHRW